jgi:ferric-dicitrate binding protein FerR (iron transport regulator)
MQWTDESSEMVPSEEESQLRREAVAWVIRLHRGGMPPEDQRAFDAWHAERPAHAHMFQNVFTVWDSAELRAAAAAVAAKPSLFNVRPSSVGDTARPFIVEGTETAV